MTGADTPANAEVARDKKKWAITYDYLENCKLDSCLTTMYWTWGPIYLNAIKQMQAGAWKPGVEYFDADSGGLGLYGFMEGQTPKSGVPKDVVPLVQAKLKDMLAGNSLALTSSRARSRTTPAKSLPAGQKIVQCDIDQFAPGAKECPAKYGMYWWFENVIAPLPKVN
jgi:basic membrane protein A